MTEEIDSLRRAKFLDNIPSLEGNGYGMNDGYGGGRAGVSNGRGQTSDQVKNGGQVFSFGAGERGGSDRKQTGEFGNERDEGRVPAERMKRHRHDVDSQQDVTGGSNFKGFPGDKEGSFSNSKGQVPGGPGSRAQVQPILNPDSIIIPAARKNKGFGGDSGDLGGIDEDPLGNKVDDNSVSLQNAEEIRLVDQPKADPMIPQLSEQIVKGLFSKNWNLRDKAVSVIGEEIRKGSKSEM